VQDRYKLILTTMTSSILRTTIATVGSHRSGTWLEKWLTCHLNMN
jgi:hypothetical protein